MPQSYTIVSGEVKDRLHTIAAKRLQPISVLSTKEWEPGGDTYSLVICGDIVPNVGQVSTIVHSDSSVEFKRWTPEWDDC